MEHVVLVDKNDNEVGIMEKMEAHRLGKLHRAFSILLFSDEGKMLLQKRSAHKYHSGSLWTNTCCSHPLPHEKIEDAARRRLNEEMGIDLQPAFTYKFLYKAELTPDLTEHELDHVFIGIFNGEAKRNTAEVEDWKFVDMSWLKGDLQLHPQVYTIWLKLIVNHPELHGALKFLSAKKH
jgi:isopentenyl-diphosphate delta-isomerase